MTLEPVGLVWRQESHELLFRHCDQTFPVAANSLFLCLAVTCPTCRATGTLEPDQLLALFLKFSPPLTCAEADRLDAEAAARTETWYRNLPGCEGLGALAEYAVFPIFLGSP